ncbi:MAG: hypothetical protein FD130_150 [Halothiobacillaceae bacterium]|nr:MAG: hypothetical protein FD130_150 [Halothiobacillaceae bacterium]
MLIVISPAKTLDYETPTQIADYSLPAYVSDAEELVRRARRYSVADLMAVMEVSEAIAELNVQRFHEWHTPFTPHNAKPALLAFKGEVYSGLKAATMDVEDFNFAQRHLRILSGLYGLLRPLDLMQPYRLEMGRKIDNQRGKNLYEFWDDTITKGLNSQFELLGSEYLINLASTEYFKVIKPKQLKARIITPAFKENKNGDYKMLGVYAKKARGLLSRFIIDNRITDPALIKEFAQEGYRYNAPMSSTTHWVFTRKT